MNDPSTKALAPDLIVSIIKSSTTMIFGPHPTSLGPQYPDASRADETRGLNLSTAATLMLRRAFLSSPHPMRHKTSVIRGHQGIKVAG
jgi:hypothetical protein